AFGFADCCSTQLDTLSPNNCKRWGWYITAPSGPYTIEGHLLVGAGGNDRSKATDAGTFKITSDGATITVTYNLFPGFDLSQVHIFVGCSLPTNCAAGQCTFSKEDFSGTSDTTFSKTFSATCSGNTYFILHAKLNQEISGGTC